MSIPGGVLGELGEWFPMGIGLGGLLCAVILDEGQGTVAAAWEVLD
jgi:hypothetical protein